MPHPAESAAPSSEAGESLDSLLQLILLQQVENAGRAGVVLELDLDCSGRMHLDWDQLGEALVRLVTEVLAGMPVGGGKLRVVSRREGPWATVSLVHSGDGLSRKSRRLLLDPVAPRQSISSRADIANARRILDDHGGSVSVGMSPEGAAALFLRFPLL